MGGVGDAGCGVWGGMWGMEWRVLGYFRWCDLGYGLLDGEV